MSNIDSLIKTLGEERVKLDEPLSSHTTLGVGGPAEILFETREAGDLIKAVRLGRNFGIPITLIGEGSNVLISDKGIKGLVIKNRGGKIKIRRKVFWSSVVEVGVESGVNLQTAMEELLAEGITGLQWFAGIPGTIGGAVANNIHGDGHAFVEVVKEIVVLNGHGGVEKISGRKIEPEEIILEVVLTLKKGGVKKAREVIVERKKRRVGRPLNLAGYAFKNISEADAEILGYPTTSAGYIVEHILNMTGFVVGGAMVSSDHHNFIVNTGGATAKDYLAVRDEIVKRAREAIGVELSDEIIRLGEFDDSIE